MSHYEVLGVDRTASAEEVRRAYLRLARRYHPDVVAGADAATRSEADERMRAANEAWRVLGDPARRKRYDQGPAVAGEEPDEGSVFRPFDTGDDPGPDDLVDTPYRPDAGADTPRRRVATIAPIALFLSSVACFSLALLFDAVSLIALAAILFVGACLGFLIVPLMALSRASRDEG